MKDFRSFGIKIRRDLDRNYYAVWDNLVTTRLDLGGPEVKLPLERSEFYDVGITERCNAGCDFCYVSAGAGGRDYGDIVGTWKSWISTFPEDEAVDYEGDEVWKDIVSPPTKENTAEEILFKLRVMKAPGPRVYTSKPFQVAIGSVGEGTIHPDFPEFLKTIYESGVVPNYTTNGIILGTSGRKRDELLEATRNFVGGVAVSYGNKKLRPQADKAIESLLSDGECKIMIHHLIKDKDSVDELLAAEKRWGKDIHYHVLLPQKAHGRSKEEMDEETYLYLTEKIKGYENLAFGMWFLPWLRKFPGSLNVWDYPEETYSANLLVGDGKIKITASSFDLKVLKEIEAKCL